MDSSGSYIFGQTRPGSASEDVTIAYDGMYRVTSVTNAAGTTTYGYVDSGSTRTTTVTDPLGHVTTYVFNMTISEATSKTDATSKVSSWQYDSAGRVTKKIAPEGNYAQYTYDGRGNVTQLRQVAKSGSGLADLVSNAGFDATCVSTAKCNKPNWTQDAKANQTDYTYDAATGNTLTVQAPAATSGGARPTTSFSYTTVNGAQVLSGTSTCLAAASCAGTANELKSSLGYNSNGLPTTITKQAGDGSVVATMTLAYDNVGNVTSVDGPLPGTADTTYYRYDADREVIGVIAPDPDGSGPLIPRAQRNTYDAKGRITLTEIGTVTDPSDAAWAAFSSQQQLATAYDGFDRPLTKTITAGGTTFSVTQSSYDHQRLDCAAVRMNSAAWGSLPASACTLQTAGSAGSDRITKLAYDNADRVTKQTSAYGTSDASDDATIAYTNNGLQQTATDANGNVTTYAYDGFDRLLTATYPGGSYAQNGYDANGNVVSRRLRDGTSIAYAYDALNRVTTKTLPSGDLAVSYGYDLLGHTTAATRSDGNNVSAAYDALGRQTSVTTAIGGTVGSQYDAGGRRTRLTWSDGFYVNYGYDTTGNMTLITENGTTNLVSFGYDNLGRRISLSRANGVTTSYGYDGASHLASLGLSYPSSTNNLTLGFSYNPAGQIASTTRSNDSYAWTGAVDADRAYTTNALNQYTAAGGTAFGYDGRGNLTSSGSSSYGYSSENMMVSAPGASLLYDPLGRLLQTVGTGTTRYGYDGSSLITEYNASNALQKRYVLGPGADETLVEYDASGNRTWLVADERGSIIARTDASGNPTINRYDEFGIPQGTNVGRHQYTGQAWLPEVGMYYYKARIYSPTMGRFMQTDPIGYSDGMNWYNYAHSDPVNGRDPTGLDDGDIVVTGINDGGINFDDLPPLFEWGSLGATIPAIGGTGDVTVTATKPPAKKTDPTTNAPQPDDIVVIGIRPQSIWSRIKGFLHTAYCALAPHPGTTLQGSVTASLAGFGGGYAGGYTAAIDKTGSIELFQTDGGYRSLGGGAGLALTGGASTAKNVGDLAGPFLQGSVTAAEAGGGTATVFAGSSPDGAVVGGEAGLDLGFQDSVMVGISNSKPVAGVSCP